MSKQKIKVATQPNARRWNIYTISLVIVLTSVALTQFRLNIFESSCKKCPECKAQETISTGELEKPKYILYDGCNRSDI